MTTPRPFLVALNGKKRSGKDTCAAALRHEFGAQRVAFADPIKRLAEAINPYVDGARGEDPAERKMLLWGLRSGLYEHAGVSARAWEVSRALATLDPFTRGTVRLRDLLREMQWDWDRIKDEQNDPRHREARRLQQIVGTEVVPDMFGVNIWAELGVQKAKGLRSVGVPVAIADCRFPNEARLVRAAGGVVVRVRRPALEGAEVDGHSTEVPLPDDLVDVEVVNDADVATLERSIIEVVEVVRA